jgi:Uma2 family endonuclease
MAAQPQTRLTPEQYLETERSAETRHEYYNGETFAMAGGTRRHALIITNLAGELRQALKRGSCQVLAQDMRTCVAADGLYTYPDIVVVCDQAKFLDDRADTLLNPKVLIEVLSPATEAHDRGFKAAQYRTLASLEEYVFVSQDEPRVEIHRRHGAEWLLIDAAGMDAACEFKVLGCQVALAEIYDKVDFEQA